MMKYLQTLRSRSFFPGLNWRCLGFKFSKQDLRFWWKCPSDPHDPDMATFLYQKLIPWFHSSMRSCFFFQSFSEMHISEMHISEMHFPKQPHPNRSQTNHSAQWCFSKDVALATTLVTIPDHDVEGVVEKVKLILGWMWRKWVVQFKTECLLEMCSLFFEHPIFTTVVVLHKMLDLF